MKPTKEQITAEILKLQTMKPTIRKHSTFMDNNWEAIEAQVRVLEEGMTDDDVYDEWENPDEYEENRYLINSAISASQWLQGDGESDTLSEEWEALVEK